MSENKSMPLVAFGPHRISRLIIGSNTLNGGSHLSRFTNMQMKSYFTPDRIRKFITYCESLGINAWQGGPGNLTTLEEHNRGSGKMHFISLAHDCDGPGPDLGSAGPDFGGASSLGSGGAGTGGAGGGSAGSGGFGGGFGGGGFGGGA